MFTGWDGTLYLNEEVRHRAGSTPAVPRSRRARDAVLPLTASGAGQGTRLIRPAPIR